MVLVRVLVLVLAVDPADERIRRSTVLERQSEIALLAEELLDIFDIVHARLVGPVVFFEVGNGGPHGNDSHFPNVAEEVELAMVAEIRLH